MKMLSLLFFLSLTNLYAADCGTFSINGVAVQNEKGFFLLINPKTLSEIQLSLDLQNGLKLTPYIGRTISAKGTIEKEMELTRGKITELSDVKEIAPDPIATASGTSLTLLKKAPCKK